MAKKRTSKAVSSGEETESQSSGSRFGEDEQEKSIASDTPLVAVRPRRSGRKKQRVEAPSSHRGPQTQRIEQHAESAPQVEASTQRAAVARVNYIPSSDRFVSQAARTRYKEWLNKRNFTDERPLAITEIQKYHPSFWEQIVDRSWQQFVVKVGECNATLVTEFYANIFIQKKDPVVYKIKMRGKEFSFDDRTINAHYGLEHNTSPEFWSKINSKQSVREWVVSCIKGPDQPPRPSWSIAGVPIKKSYLSFDAKAWYGFVITRLMPSQSDGAVVHEQSILISALCSKWPINVGEVIEREIIKVSRQPGTNLIFGNLLTAMMREQGIPEMVSDTIRPPVRPYDIFSTKDKNNPQTLAKRPPVASSGQSEEPTITSLIESAGPSSSSQDPSSTATGPTSAAPLPSPPTPVIPPSAPPAGSRGALQAIASWMQKLESRLDMGSTSLGPSASSTSSQTQHVDLSSLSASIERMVVALEDQNKRIVERDQAYKDLLEAQNKKIAEQTQAYKELKESVEENTLWLVDLKKTCVSAEVLRQFGDRIAADTASFDFDEFMASTKQPQSQPTQTTHLPHSTVHPVPDSPTTQPDEGTELQLDGT